MEKTKSGNRRLIPIGGSIGITLPKRFLQAKGWKAGDKVGLVLGDVAVIVRPQFTEESRAGEDNGCRTVSDNHK